MSGISAAKRIFFTGARACGAYSAFRRSGWRTERLLILGYHGISLHDEHVWRGGLFMSASQFAGRMEIISRMGCTVLPLAEAINRLQSGTLPPMSVVITFDDGFHNFIAAAHPILKRYGYPVTLYQTTFYADCNKPVFHLLCHYLLWKASGKTIDARSIIGSTSVFYLRTEKGIDSARNEIWTFVRASHLSQEERQEIARALAHAVGVDYQFLMDRRLFHLMNRYELSEMVTSGVDVQLHTHRHRLPATKELFFKELTDNQEFLKEIGQPKAEHFTYPSGIYRENIFPWLAEFGVRSATTCETGLVNSGSMLACLPRLIDVPQISDLEFEAWLCGFRGALYSRNNGTVRAQA
jgi:peptidoglycan/xylan/chitin deacetylase (PgdA/CDA1 family)